MSIQDIRDLPIQNICDDNCILFMWVTGPKLNEFMSVIDAWGFEYKTCAFTWIKTNKRASPKQLTFLPSDHFYFDSFWGMGRWTRSNAEFCMLAIKGRIRRKSGEYIL